MAEFTCYQGDCLDVLGTLPAGSVHCCVTSPPYFGLRDYGTAKWEGGEAECDHVVGKARNDVTPERLAQRAAEYGTGQGDGSKVSSIQARHICPKCGANRVDQQLGLEETPDAYVAKMVEVFREVRRVLRDDATCWINLGDSYVAHGMQGGTQSKETSARMFHGADKRGIPGLKPKDLCGMPWRVAFALQADGWYLRQDIIWAKPNPMPESVTDRCTKAHEYVFLLTKKARYYYDAHAIREHGVDAEAITFYNESHGNKVGSGIRTSLSGNGGRPKKAARGGCAIPNIQKRKGETRNLFEIGEDEKAPQGVAGVGGRAGLPEDVSQEREKKGCPSQVRQNRQVQEDPQAISSDGQGKGKPLAGSTQEAGGHATGGMRSDGETVERNQDEAGASLRDMSEKEGSDEGPHPADIEGRPAHGEEYPGALPELQQQQGQQQLGRNRRSVWTVATHSFPGAHFATFPPKLIEPCILAGTSEEGCCPKCGAPWERVVEKTAMVIPERNQSNRTGCEATPMVRDGDRRRAMNGQEWAKSASTTTTGWRPTCDCIRELHPNRPMCKAGWKEYAEFVASEMAPVPCTVLDPFLGAGTTALVALQYGRHAVGIELNPEYLELARCRLAPLLKPRLFE